MSEKGDGSLLVVCNSDETSPTCIAFFVYLLPFLLFISKAKSARVHYELVIITNTDSI